MGHSRLFICTRVPLGGARHTITRTNVFKFELIKLRVVCTVRVKPCHNFSIFHSWLTFMPSTTLNLRISSNNITYSPWHCVIYSSYYVLHVNFLPGRLAFEEWILSGSVRHLFQFQNRTTGVVMCSILEQSNSATQTLGDTINAFFIAVHWICCTCDNLPKTLQGRQAPNKNEQHGPQRWVRTRSEKWWMERKTEKENSSTPISVIEF